MDAGIARTRAALDDEEDIREVETLFLESIDHAEHAIYIENQYLTAFSFAQRLAKRMREKPDLEVVIIAPKESHSWLEKQSMEAGLARFVQSFDDSMIGSRIQLLYPSVGERGATTDTMVHSKVMIVDDGLLRIGSANLNNRSFVLDTECDVMVEATTPKHRQAILHIRNTLLGHHCGVSADRVAAAIDEYGSLVAAARSLRSERQCLRPIEIIVPTPGAISAIQGLGDPEQPISPPAFLAEFVGERPTVTRMSRLVRLMGAGLGIIALALIWYVTPLSELLNPEALHQALGRLNELSFAPLIVLAVYTLAGVCFFPITLLITATGAVFGPWLGLTYALLGTILSATVSFGLGAIIGRDPLENLLGPRLNRVRNRLVASGILTIAGVRMVPLAPFALVNLVAGASRIRFLDFLIGTLLGMVPGMILLTALGHQILLLITQPTTLGVFLLVVTVLGWIGLGILLQYFMIRMRRRHRA